MRKIEKSKCFGEKTAAIWLSKYVKTKAVSPLLFSGQISLLFLLFGLFLAQNMSQNLDFDFGT